ncbi:MAG: hypothetical protein IJ315_00735 [Firmicutes bacterium]|nr:hypothetical protein [Bacillota bacterium]
MKSIILKGNDTTAYRDPAVYYDGETFYLFCTYSDTSSGVPYLTTIECTSKDLVHWTEPVELTPRDIRLNYSSPGNVIHVGDEYIMCLQTYCRENGEKYGNDRCRVWTMHSKDLLHWSEPELLRVKGDVPVEDMGRMIDPYLVQDLQDKDKWWCLYKQNGVSMSYSYDLQNWTFHGYTESGENVCALPYKDSYLIYHSPDNGIGVMQTKDFEHFSEFCPLITLGQDHWEWAKGRITAGFVLDLTKDPKYGKYIMFFHGSGPQSELIDFNINASIAYAWSDDLLHWEWEE